jgi:hypothetical protein
LSDKAVLPVTVLPATALSAILHCLLVLYCMLCAVCNPPPPTLLYQQCTAHVSVT